MSEFTPSTVPGCRTPHLWLGNGRSLYDALGPEYTLLRLDPAIGAGPLQQTAAAQGVPLSVLDLVSEAAAALDRSETRTIPPGPTYRVAR
jgi:hypothetical protein